jgi:sulfide dehydrogenase [flavocytochrome c] flavoprotein subunit
MMDRRAFLGAVGVGSLAALAPLPARSATVGRVVVVGGGMAGATAAKYLRLWSGNTIDVTLVEQSTAYVSNIMSNLALTGQVAMSSLNYTWSNLVKKYGVRLVTGRVTAIEPGGASGTWKVTAVNGATTTVRYCERVVLAPGIAFDPVPETGNPAVAASILHAWQAGPQTNTLKQQLMAMPAGGTVVMTIPPKPYRCPPGPYERACVIADYLKRNKPGSKVLVLDANAGITAEAENFTYAFDVLYGRSVLEYVPNTRVLSVASAANTVSTSWGDFRASVLNVIPPHRAGAIAQAVGLANTTNIPWVDVDARSYESSIRGIHVLGDSSSTGLPKAGHVGNQGAKICADAIVRAFALQPPDPAPTANSACYSPVSGTLASWLTAVYQYNPATGKMEIHDMVDGSTLATEASAPSTGNFSKMNTWFKALMLETYS